MFSEMYLQAGFILKMKDIHRSRINKICEHKVVNM